MFYMALYLYTSGKQHTPKISAQDYHLSLLFLKPSLRHIVDNDYFLKELSSEPAYSEHLL